MRNLIGKTRIVNLALADRWHKSDCRAKATVVIARKVFGREEVGLQIGEPAELIWMTVKKFNEK